MEPRFATFLWAVIAAIELVLVFGRIFLQPGPVRLSMSLSIPLLFILGAVINAIYNRVTTGHILDAPPRRQVPRH